MSDGASRLLMLERQAEEFVDRVGRLGAEPPEQRLAAAVLAKKERVKAEGESAFARARQRATRRAAAGAKSSPETSSAVISEPSRPIASVIN